MKLKEILELIPADNLHYSEIEKEWRFFSDKEYEKMVLRLAQENVDIERMMIFLKEVEKARQLNILVSRFLNDEVTFNVKDGVMKWQAK